MNKMSACLISGLLLCTSAKAGSKPTQDLLNQVERPTMADLEKALNPWPEQNPWGGASSGGWSYRDFGGLAKAIAAFERLFPGATFYELGRDAAYLGDAMDAFYRSIGQPDRVRRLDASNTSFKKHGQEFPNTDALVYYFLKTNGLDFEKLKDGPPYVMFDVTSFSHNSGVGGGASQSTRLIRAAYAAYAALGGNPQDLVHKVNFISVGMFRGADFFTKYGPDFKQQDFDAFFAEQEKTTGVNGYFNAPWYVETHGFTYTSEWHGIFESFQVQPDGSVISPPGSPSSKSTREGILSELYQLKKQVMTPEFRAEVQNWAHAIGYEFPLQRQSELVMVPKEVSANARANMQRIESERAARRAREELEAKRAKRQIKGMTKQGVELMDQYEILLASPGSMHIKVRQMLQDAIDRKKLNLEDRVGVLKLALASEWNSSATKVINETMEAITMSREFKAVWEKEKTNIKTDLYGENDYRVEANASDLNVALGGEPLKKKSWGSCYSVFGGKGGDDDDDDGFKFDF